MVKKSKPQIDKAPYWAHFFDDFNSATKIWLDGFDLTHHAMTNSTATFQRKKVPFSKKQLAAITLTAKKYNLPIESICHAAWALLLNRFSGSDDIIYGMAGYPKNLSIDKVTSCHSLLPVRSITHDKESILHYIETLDQQLHNNKKYARAYNSLLLNQPDIANYFIYLLLYADNKAPKFTDLQNMQGLEINHYPLMLVIHKSMVLEFFYNTNKFTDHSIDILIEHLVLIFVNITNDIQQAVEHFSILTNNEKSKLLHLWNKPAFKKALNLNHCVHDLFIKQVKLNPNQLLVTNGEASLTYQDADELSNQIAHFLVEKQIQPGDTVAVLIERSPAIIVVMLAIFKIGAIYVPINPKYPDDRIDFVINDSDAKLILVNNLERLSESQMTKSYIINDHYELIKSYSKKPLSVKTNSSLIAYIIYTSGTTGQPKGVMIKHVSLVNLVHWYKEYFNITENDRASQFASPGFDTFFCETVPFLSVGASIYLVEDREKLTPTAFLPWIAKHKITILDLPTAYAQIVLNLEWPSCPQLRILKIGGEAITQYPTKTVTFDIYNSYGPTEATVEATYIKLYAAHVAHDDQPLKHLPPPIGKPIANSEMYVVDQHLEPVPIGDVGELLIGGICLSAGYWNRKQLTRDKFIRNIFSNDPNAKLYRTGDLVRWMEDGNLEFIGRIDHQVKIRGYRIELSEIENALGQHPDIAEAIVLTKELNNNQKSLVAYLVTNLNKIRIPFHERCLVTTDNGQFYDAITDDISKEGIALSGINNPFTIGDVIKLNFKLPGGTNSQWLTGHVIWQIESRVGIQFEDTLSQCEILDKSIEYYLATHNLMDTIKNAETKRSIRKALMKKLPEYMIPSVFTLLPSFPLTFNGKIDWKALPPPQDFERLLDRKYVAPRTPTEIIICDIWSDILNIKQISITDNFFDLGGNSLLASQLAVSLLQKFNRAIPIKIILDLPFIPILAEYIDSDGKKYTYQTMVQTEINHDAILNDDINPTLQCGDIKNPGGILLTGAGGFLGIYLLRELIKSTNAKIYCLIRKGDFENAAQRLIQNIEHYQLGQEISLNNRRIIIIASDIGSHQFGLAQEQYNNLLEKVDVIYHCGAQVNTMASYSALRNSNVQGTIEVIKFATQKIDKAIHYISTLSAAYKLDHQGCYAEEFPDAETDKLTGGYAISKWVSERLLTQIKNRGLPVSIYRSGYIFGQSDTGIMNTNDALLLLIKGCIQLGYAPEWNEQICILPVDFISKAIVGISLNHPETSLVYHLDHPRGILWDDLIKWLNQYGYQIISCSHQEWRTHLMTIDSTNALYHFLPYYLSMENAPKTPETSMRNTKKALEEILLPYPDIDDKQLTIYFDYLCQAGHYPWPQNSKKITV